MILFCLHKYCFDCFWEVEMVWIFFNQKGWASSFTIILPILFFQEDKQSHHHHELCIDNLGICSPTSILPLPHKEGFPFQINSYDDVDEPIFNSEIHLQLEMPEEVRVLPDFEKMKTTPVIDREQNGSRFAYSAPFQV